MILQQLKEGRVYTNEKRYKNGRLRRRLIVSITNVDNSPDLSYVDYRKNLGDGWTKHIYRQPVSVFLEFAIREYKEGEDHS